MRLTRLRPIPTRPSIPTVHACLLIAPVALTVLCVANLWRRGLAVECVQFVSDFKIADKRSKFLKRADLDRLFVAVDAQAAMLAKQSKGEMRQQLKVIGRVEFLMALVLVAIKRYVKTGLLDDVSEAVHKFLDVDLAPLADRRLIVDSNSFRRQFAYKEAETTILLQHESSLRATFDALTAACYFPSKSLLTLDIWLHFLRAVCIIGVDVSQRDATLAFAASRMAVVNTQTDRGWFHDTHLPFEGFCEALCRMAVLKALPTAEEIASAPEDALWARKDAGSYFKWLHAEDEERYEAILRERGKPWGAEPSQSLAWRVDALLSIVFRNMEEESQGKDNMLVTRKEADGWARANGMESK
jgi:hypothetical protein